MFKKSNPQHNLFGVDTQLSIGLRTRLKSSWAQLFKKEVLPILIRSEEKLEQLAQYSYKLIAVFENDKEVKHSAQYQLLKRLFHEQCEVTNKAAIKIKNEDQRRQPPVCLRPGSFIRV